MVEMRCWETYLVHGWKKIEHPNLCWTSCTIHSPGLERTQVIPGNLFI